MRALLGTVLPLSIVFCVLLSAPASQAGQAALPMRSWDQIL